MVIAFGTWQEYNKSLLIPKGEACVFTRHRILDAHWNRPYCALDDSNIKFEICFPDFTYTFHFPLFQYS